MYKIYSDGYIVYHPRLPEYAILSGRLELEVNKAGKLTFKIPESNPNCGMMMLMKSIVEPVSYTHLQLTDKRNCRRTVLLCSSRQNPDDGKQDFLL